MNTAHSLITECFRQKLDTIVENFVNNVVFNTKLNGVVHVLDFFCANIIKMKKN